jgi:hypothetical protein
MNTPLPKDPIILLSYLNTQLRDFYSNLDDLCLSLGVKKDDLIETMKSIDYEYDEDKNRFL